MFGTRMDHLSHKMSWGKTTNDTMAGPICSNTYYVGANMPPDVLILIMFEGMGGYPNVLLRIMIMYSS